MEAAGEAKFRGCCPGAPTEWGSQLGNKRSFQLHVRVEKNDSDVEDGECMKPVCNLRHLHQKRMNENEKVGEKNSKELIGFPISWRKTSCSVCLIEVCLHYLRALINPSPHRPNQQSEQGREASRGVTLTAPRADARMLMMSAGRGGGSFHPDYITAAGWSGASRLSLIWPQTRHVNSNFDPSLWACESRRVQWRCGVSVQTVVGGRITIWISYCRITLFHTAAPCFHVFLTSRQWRFLFIKTSRLWIQGIKHFHSPLFARWIFFLLQKNI